MVETLITFSKAEVNPPVFVAGTFTEWQPVELDHTEGSPETNSATKYHKKFDCSLGEHQYKFRLGEGDWWVCDEVAPRAFDASGNENNVLEVKPNTITSSTDDNTVTKASSIDANKDESSNRAINGSAITTRPAELLSDVTASAASLANTAQSTIQPAVDSTKQIGTEIFETTKQSLPEQVTADHSYTKSEGTKSLDVVAEKLTETSQTITSNVKAAAAQISENVSSVEKEVSKSPAAADKQPAPKRFRFDIKIVMAAAVCLALPIYISWASLK